MNSINFDQGNAGTQSQGLQQSYGPYEPSIASSASSSQYSVFSDSASAQSSIASSISDDFRGSQEDPRDRYCAIAQLQSQAQAVSQFSQPCRQQQPSYADVTSVPSEQRQHPRRCSLARNQRPPPLVRQAERKLTFVDNLVDSATQMVEVIWPLSTVPCQGEGSSGRSVLPLRTYIEETLRRSRTSYSTLQVALYYLVLIKAFVPHRDFTMEQSGDCPASRALMCGRRMFLAALILASKYLQDRNYSTKAWSKMSGLKVAEINSNERTFLAKIGWKLHVAKPLFDRWTDIVLKYQTMPPSGSPGHGIAIEELCWKRLVPMLTPELDNVPLPERMVKVVTQATFSPDLSSPATPTPTRSAIKPIDVDSPYEETTPTPASICPPRFLEPQTSLNPPTLPRLGPLPTPQMTPSTCATNTPAASVIGSRRPSICSAMATAYRNGLNRCTTDDYPFAGLDKYRTSRRPSISSSLSLGSSPESMMSDHTRSSRASSISSVTTVSSASSCVAPPRANLARLATTRNARLPMPCVIDVDETKENQNQGTATKPIIIGDEDDSVELSPPDFSISEKKLHAPHRHSKYQQQPTSMPLTEKTRKRNRLSRGNRRSDLYDEVRYQLEEDRDVEMIDLVDSDEDVVSPSPAATQATNMLRRENTSYLYKEPQPPASLSRRDSSRVPVQRNESKRSCCTPSAAMLRSRSRQLV